MRRFTLLSLLSVVLLLFVALPLQAAAPPAFPDLIPLPNGFQPEGIAVGRGHTFYAGSLAGGAIYAGDLRTGEGDILVSSSDAGMAVGLAVDDRANTLFVSGGLSGMATVYDAGSGALLQSYQLTTSATTFINDVIVTRDAAYFTDSFQPQLYRLPLGPGGSLPPASAVETITLGGEFDFVAGPFVFNANGIEATPDGGWLFVINSQTGTLYRVDPASGEATAVSLTFADGLDASLSLFAGDGLVLAGHTMYVVQNNFNQIAKIELDPGYTSGMVTEVITDGDFQVPTTAAQFGSHLYAVNARFDVPSPGPDTTYDIVQVGR